MFPPPFCACCSRIMTVSCSKNDRASVGNGDDGDAADPCIVCTAGAMLILMTCSRLIKFHTTKSPSPHRHMSRTEPPSWYNCRASVSEATNAAEERMCVCAHCALRVRASLTCSPPTPPPPTAIVGAALIAVLSNALPASPRQT